MSLWRNNQSEVRFVLKNIEMVQEKVLCVVTPCSVVVRYQCFRGSCCLHHQGEVNGAGKADTDIGRKYKKG